MLISAGGSSGGKGARLRIRHRLAPLPLAAPRGAAFAAPPASPSPECGIEGLPAAEGPHRAARGSGRKRPPEGILPALAAASCRRAPAAPEAALGEMVARGGGFVSPPGLAGLRSRGGGSQGLILSPDRRVPRPLPGRSAGPQPPGSDLERFQRSSRCPAAGRLPAGFSGGIVPPRQASARSAPCSRRSGLLPAHKRVVVSVSTDPIPDVDSIVGHVNRPISQRHGYRDRAIAMIAPPIRLQFVATKRLAMWIVVEDDTRFPDAALHMRREGRVEDAKRPGGTVTVPERTRQSRHCDVLSAPPSPCRSTHQTSRARPRPANPRSTPSACSIPEIG